MIFTLPLMLAFVGTYKSHPTISLIIFVIMGFVTMMATPVVMVMAQNTLPEYKSIISGFINGFSWGIVAIVMSMLGFVAENFGITNVLIFVAIIPAVCSVLVKNCSKTSKKFFRVLYNLKRIYYASSKHQLSKYKIIYPTI